MGQWRHAQRDDEGDDPAVKRLLFLRRTEGRSRGQTLVEFALVLPLFLLILMSLVDFGRVIYAQNAITQDAREAVRVGAVGVDVANQTLALMQAKYQAIRNAAKIVGPGVVLTDVAITGTTGDCVLYADPLGTHTCFYPDGTQIGGRVVVNMQITVPILTPFVSNIVGGSFNLTATSTAYIQ
jgi:Flp pilus assembly protein TadG